MRAVLLQPGDEHLLSDLHQRRELRERTQMRDGKLWSEGERNPLRKTGGMRLLELR